MGYYFNHYEKITIPKECILGGLEATHKDIFIGTCVAQKHYEGDDVSYLTSWFSKEIVLSYRVEDSDTVFIYFPNSK